MANIYDAIPKDLSTEVFERLLGTKTIKVERIISKGHSSPPVGWYNQNTSEWVLLLKGAAVIVFEEDAPAILKAGDYIDIPAHKKHRVEWTDPESESIWLAIHYQ